MGAGVIESPLAEVQAAEIAEEAPLPAPVPDSAGNCERSLPVRSGFFEPAQMLLQRAKVIEHHALQGPICKLASERQGLRVKSAGFLHAPVSPVKIGYFGEHVRP